jgi:MtN3 and saliva related transmembrane protein
MGTTWPNPRQGGQAGGAPTGKTGAIRTIRWIGTARAAGLACTAKALLAEAGFPNGFKAKAEVLKTGEQYQTAYQPIAADLAKIGVQMEMVSMTIPDLVGKLTRSRALGRHGLRLRLRDAARRRRAAAENVAFQLQPLHARSPGRGFLRRWTGRGRAGSVRPPYTPGPVPMFGFTFVTAIGVVAALLTTIAFLPQALKAWQTKSTQDISLAMYALMATGNVLWLVYGLLLDSLPLIGANIVSLTLTTSIIALKLRFR